MTAHPLFRQRVVAGLGIATAVLISGLCGSVLLVGTWLSSPAVATIGMLPPDLAAFEPVEIPSTSGSVLHGWWAPGTTPGTGAVMLLHGVWENRRRMIPRARKLHEQGFGVLLFDLQAHGESPGQRITFGRLEGLDAAAAADFVRRHAPGERVGAIGASLGGAAILLGPEPLMVDAIVLESVYPDIDAALAHRLRAGLGPIIGPILTPLLAPAFKLLLPPILGVTPGELRPIDRIGTIRAPILVASGTIDDRTPLIEAQALYDHAPEPKQFWAVRDAAHVDLERFDPKQYWTVVLPFLTKYLKHDGGMVR